MFFACRQLASHPLHLSWLLSALLVTSPIAHAQDLSSGARVTQLLGVMCPRHVLGMLSRPELATVLRSKPVDVLSVCSCTEKAIASDSRLQAYLNIDEVTLKTRFASEQFKSYIVTRLIISSLACLMPALEDSLAASPLSQ